MLHRYAHGVERSGVEQSKGPRALTDGVRTADEWIAVVDGELSVGEVYDWAVRPDCGAVVVFSGTIRDHSVEGSQVRSGVQFLEYEAYASEALVRMGAIAEAARASWPTLGRIAIIHRIGRVDVGESSVVVVASSPHRPEAFEVARFAIDALKSSVPIWKHETWDGGSDWGLGATEVSSVTPAADVGEARSE
jgi:molybdopterin synthase catalytic subunit